MAEKDKSTSQEQPRGNLENSKTRQPITLMWVKGPKAPCKMGAGSSTFDDAVGMAYFNPRESRVVYEFDLHHKKWSTLPECRYDDFTVVVINGLLTAVGGRDLVYKKTNRLMSLKDQKWVEHFPCMRTSRIFAVVLCYRNHLIVAGGDGDAGEQLTSVEVMNADTNEWSFASPLPRHVSLAPATICGERIFIFGSYDGPENFSVLTCSIQELLQSLQPNNPGTCHLESDSTSRMQSKPWHNIADLPVVGSTCATVDGNLLTFGGCDSEGKETRAIHKYDRTDNRWEVCGHMTSARSSCMVQVLPDSRLIIVGGVTEKGLIRKQIQLLNTVEISM